MEDPWIFSFGQGSGRLRLFCLPYAGGSASVYRDWQQHLPADVEVCAFELPGRHTRLREEPFRNVPALVDAVAHVVHRHSDVPFALFGHSLGALVAFEVTQKLHTDGLRGPEALLLSGAAAPQLVQQHKPLWRLPDQELVQELLKFGGTPREVIDEPEIMKAFLPALRADFELFGTYRARPPTSSVRNEGRLKCATWVLGGDADPLVSPAQLAAWIDVTQLVSLQLFSGGHFFVHEQRKAVLNVTNQALKQTLQAVA